MNNSNKGFVFGIIGAALYGLNPLFALPLYDMGMQADEVLLFRYLLASVIMAGVLIFKKESFLLSKKEFETLVFMGTLFAVSSLSLFKSYNFMAAGLATTMQFIYPVLVVLIMSRFMKERLNFRTILIIAMTLLGVSMLYKGDGYTLSSLGISLALLSALLYAVYLVGVNMSVLKNMSVYRLSFYTIVFGTFVFVIDICFSSSSSFTIPSLASWKYLIAMAFLPSNVSLLFTAMALKFIGSTRTSILGVFEPLTAIFVGVIIFHEVMTFRIAMGIIILITAVSLMILSTNKSINKHVMPLHNRNNIHSKFLIYLRQK